MRVSQESKSASGAKAVGAAGEDAAALFLSRAGYRIRHRNWRPRGAAAAFELDIVAGDRSGLIFVEVKTRRRPPGPDGAGRIPVHAAFTPLKKSRLIKAAQYYLAEHQLWSLPCRFDLICVEQGPCGHPALEHHRNVIELRNIVGGGDTNWQPW